MRICIASFASCVLALVISVGCAGSGPPTQSSVELLRGVDVAADTVTGWLGIDSQSESTIRGSNGMKFDAVSLEKQLTGGRSPLVWREVKLSEFLKGIADFQPEEAILVDKAGEAYVFLGPVLLHDSAVGETRNAYHFCHGYDSLYVADQDEIAAKSFDKAWIGGLSRRSDFSFIVGDSTIQFSRVLCSLGVVPLGTEGTADVKITNTGTAALQLGTPITNCGCTAATIGASELQPGQSVDMQIRLTPSGRQTGLVSTRQVIEVPIRNISSGATRNIRINVVCLHERGLELSPAALDFGTLRPGESVVRTVRLSESPSARFDVNAVQFKGPEIAYKVTNEIDRGLRTYIVELNLTSDGFQQGEIWRNEIRISTTSPREPVVVVPYRAKIKPRVEASPSVIRFRDAQMGRLAAEKFQLESVNGEMFRVSMAANPDSCLVDIHAGESDRHTCTVKASFDSPGLWKRTLTLTLAGDRWTETLVVNCFADVQAAAP